MVTSTATPLPVLAARATATSVELSWPFVQGAARYEVWVWDSVNDWRQLGGKTLTGTSCSHTDVAVGTTSLYLICTVDASGQLGPWSPNLYVTVPAQEWVPQQQQEATPTPTAPTPSVTTNSRAIGAISVASNPFDTSPANVSWNAPIETPTDYQVNWARADESYSAGADFNAYPTGRSYTITGLENVRHKVRVRARYNGSFGPWISMGFGGP